ncbi:uncharacterized protein LOC110735952 [Chenopodium quinoa]|uniref:uncharacterized protein LOC110735952 n=1 Tax=Chenopodium quinoa TaxID=63459 RepID=UPI000B7935B3|nr:uncharacterized protein LOC110735952 [Chenopodium quinoa]
MLENQMAQIASALKGKSSTSLPSQGLDPREQAHAIVTRSGKSLGEIQGKGMQHDLEGEKSKERVIEMSDSHGEFAGSRLDEQFAKFLEVLRKLYVNIPFTDAIKQMPTYAKFLKDILSNKREFDFVETINMPNCSAIIQNKFPTKLKVPGSFSIPCAIGEMVIDRALCDLGASISLIPLSICKRLGLGELKPTNISLQLADRSVKMPLGKLEDVPLRVGKLYIPVDFIVLDMDEDLNVPIILGRPFLATAGAIIDVKHGKLSLLVGKEKVEFKLNQVMKCPSNMDDCMSIDIVENVINESIQFHLHNTNDSFEYELESKDRSCNEDMEMEPIEEILDSTPMDKEEANLVIGE